MTTKMDAEPNDDPEVEEPAAADDPADADPEGDDAESDEFAHLDSLSDGAGCAEVWEHLSEARDGE